MAKEIKFDVCHPGEMGAGIWGYSDAVTVTVENDPGGEEGEFEKYMRECLAEWFDGAKVTPNDRVEGRDAALSRRVPSHDGLEGNGT